MTARAVFYQAEVKGVVGKDHSGYKMVVADLKFSAAPVECRMSGSLTRREGKTYPSLMRVRPRRCGTRREHYWKSLWTDADCVVQIWLEKAALEGVIEEVTHEYDVPLMVARGYGSLSFLHKAAMDLDAERPTYIYYLGDHDPSGENAGEVTEERLRELAADADLIHFKRIAVTSEQIEKWDLPTRPTKTSDSRARNFVDEDGEQRPSVELDAIEPRRLRAMVKACILKHQPQKVFDKLERQQERERADALEAHRENAVMTGNAIDFLASLPGPLADLTAIHPTTGKIVGRSFNAKGNAEIAPRAEVDRERDREGLRDLFQRQRAKRPLGIDRSVRKAKDDPEGQRRRRDRAARVSR